MLVAMMGLALALVTFIVACCFLTPKRAFLAAITFVPGAMGGCLFVLAMAAVSKGSGGGALTSGAAVAVFFGSLAVGGVVGGAALSTHFLGVNVAGIVRRTILKLRGRSRL
jgi:hypothetical protein